MHCDGVSAATICHGLHQVWIEDSCIGDLKHVTGYQDVVVKLGPLDHNQLKLFLAIEMPDWEANDDKHNRPSVPFPTSADGKPEMPKDFGSIGHFVSLHPAYLDLEYDDKTSLWDKLFVPNSVQVDMFNFKSQAAGHPNKVSTLPGHI